MRPIWQVLYVMCIPQKDWKQKRGLSETWIKDMICIPLAKKRCCSSCGRTVALPPIPGIREAKAGTLRVWGQSGLHSAVRPCLKNQIRLNYYFKGNIIIVYTYPKVSCWVKSQIWFPTYKWVSVSFPILKLRHFTLLISSYVFPQHPLETCVKYLENLRAAEVTQEPKVFWRWRNLLKPGLCE